MKRILVYGLANHWGGIESIVLSIIRYMPGEYVFDLLLSKGECQYKDRLPEGNVRVMEITSWGSHPFRFGKELKELYQHVHYDFVWLNLACRSNRQILSLTRKYSQARILLHAHGSSFETGNWLKFGLLSILHHVNKRFYLKNMDYALACSKKSAIWFFGKHAIREYSVCILKNGIDTEQFAFCKADREKYRAMLGVTNELTFLHVGRLSPVKNQKFILEIFRDFLKVNSKAVLWIVGEGELRNKLEEYSRHLGIQDQVFFLGQREDVEMIMQGADIFLLSSFHEGLPIVLIEAQTAGLLCLSSANVSVEAKVTDLLHFLPINKGTQAWVKNIHQIPEGVRRSYQKEVKAEGYDIVEVVENMKNILINKIDRYE